MVPFIALAAAAVAALPPLALASADEPGGPSVVPAAVPAASPPAALPPAAAHGPSPTVASPVTAGRTVGRWHLRLGSGINWLDQESGHPQPADPGFGLRLAGGYIGEAWGVELETGYITNELPAVPGRTRRSLEQVPVLFNVIRTFPNRTALTPYLGAGLGVAFMFGKIQSDPGHTDSGGDLALNLMIGLHYAVGERTSIGLDYRYMRLTIVSALAEESVGNDSVLLNVKVAL